MTFNKHTIQRLIGATPILYELYVPSTAYMCPLLKNIKGHIAKDEGTQTSIKTVPPPS